MLDEVNLKMMKQELLIMRMKGKKIIMSIILPGDRPTGKFI